ncbi:PREDICTED: single-strand selective monofunctional uracil DNA glycosylase [Trachymyrmex cornetzi]|uniref:Single-strand selective monofunctional uracil DNA glycosylase n=1 Tax=Trachymyrmex cornetzi TaxID=471704 RepID=A0A195DIB8_9HYME|nr:PREDICTED: single-strand selective monofunctional uracil DNA glycosylase [Trachymyrmex cornetzi]KYN12635.1 Single-strand selective monofunctional uracil DNA glycosylase [Trachymyrmex cornetzi]
MSHAKRTRAKSDDLSSEKKLKRSNSNVVDYMTQIQTNLGIKNTDIKEDTSTMSEPVTKAKEDTSEHASTISTLISDRLLSIEQELCTKLKDIIFPSLIQYIYNPLEYASETHAMYVHKYCTGIKKILFVGMNPGPWGMSQTGVPFGEINMVRDWLKISGPIGKPSKEHPDRKVIGFQCTRSEVSGLRLWGLFQELCGNPENFFRYAYMHNYCPLAFMDGKARNITPAEIKGDGQKILHEACDKSLTDIIQLLKVEIVIGIGNYAEKRAQIAVQTGGLPVKVMVLRHPSPRALGNQNWKETAKQRLNELELLKYFDKASTTV